MQHLERIGNIHVHTTSSDGTASHEQIAEIANRVGLDFVIVTDHNVIASDKEGWYASTLLLVGQEIHNPDNEHANHLLVLNARQDLAPLAGRTQELIQAVERNAGLSFIAHPYEHSGAYSQEPEINWEAWDSQGFTGIEIWNYMSEFKSRLADLAATLFFVTLPKAAMSGPYPETLCRWDELLQSSKVWAIGGSDAHATEYRLGPLRRRIFSYEHLFGSLNTHILITRPWTGNATHDGPLVYDALAHGRAFVAYDGLLPARGFWFEAQHRDQTYIMGDEVRASGPVRFEVRSPAEARLRLVLNGHCIAEKKGFELSYEGQTPGAYRVEAYLSAFLKRRGWVFSNPIFVRTESRSPVKSMDQGA